MRQLFFISFFVLSVSSWGKSLTREVPLKFENNGLVLTKEIKNKILESYLEIGNGDWICFKTISETEINNNRSLAFKNAKIRNRRISEFLLKNGISQDQFKFKYSSFENVWLLKPQHFRSSVKVLNKNDTSNQIIKSFKNSEGCTFLLKSGNIIEFKSMSFEGFSSDLITVRIQEFNSKFDFVKYGVTAQGDQGMLETQGMYFVEAFSNGQKVNLRPRVSYTLKIKEGKSDVPFYSFYGKETNGQLIWTKNSQQKFYSVSPEESNSNSIDEEYNSGSTEFIGIEYVEDSYGELVGVYIRETQILGNHLVGQFSGLGWINCDRFYDAEETITMKFSVDGGDSDTPYSVYLIFKDINSVLPIYKITNGTYQTPQIPKGAKATILAVQVKDKLENKLAFQDITINENTVVNLKSSVIKKENLDGYMRDIIF
tara:strand:+ start:646 stop:1929 length:1284 start_codon:yes stop_codon:yes gene_type:complete